MVAGIIAEFNPMHEGHKYLIDKTRHEPGADKIIACISGSYVQRGIPAILDKYIRAKAALLSGVDMVIELPVAASLGSAEYFAMGAIGILNSTGIVDFLSFGSEIGDLKPLQEAAGLLTCESEAFKNDLKRLIASGLTYPQAVAGAFTRAHPDYAKLLGEPNNTLGIEYLKALRITKSSIQPFTIQRNGASYNSEDFNVEKDVCPSATHLRKCLEGGNNDSFFSNISKEMNMALTESGISREALPFLTCDDFTLPLIYRLTTGQADNFMDISDMSGDLINRLLNNYSGRSFSEIAEIMHSKNLTLARANRTLLHLLLDISKNDMEALKKPAKYIHVLGIRKESSGLLKKMIKDAKSPVICRYSDLKNLDIDVKKTFEKDLKACELYRQIFLNKYPDSSYKPEKDLSGLILV